MKLSQVLQNLIVVPAGQTAIVGFHIRGENICLSWEYDDEEYTVYAEDQEIVASDIKGQFTIIDEEGDAAVFFAYSEHNFASA